MKIGVICFAREDVEAFQSRREEGAGHDVFAVRSPPGRLEAAVTAWSLIRRKRVERVLIVGAAVSLRRSVQRGIFFVASRVEDSGGMRNLGGEQGATRVFASEGGFSSEHDFSACLIVASMARGIRTLFSTLVTGEDIRIDSDAAARMRNDVDAYAADAATSGAAYICVRSSVPWCGLYLINAAPSDYPVTPSYESDAASANERADVFFQALDLEYERNEARSAVTIH